MSPAVTAPVSLSATPVVSAYAIPVEKYMDGKSKANPDVPGSGRVSTGVSVPTVGAVALLYSFKYRSDVLLLYPVIKYRLPVEALATVALVLAAADVMRLVLAGWLSDDAVVATAVTLRFPAASSWTAPLPPLDNVGGEVLYSPTICVTPCACATVENSARASSAKNRLTM
jgi:hypothetical protein